MKKIKVEPERLIGGGAESETQSIEDRGGRAQAHAHVVVHGLVRGTWKRGRSLRVWSRVVQIDFIVKEEEDSFSYGFFN